MSKDVVSSSNAKVINFPETRYILRCKECYTNDFYIYLKSRDPYDIAGYECCGCGGFWEIKSSNKADQPDPHYSDRIVSCGICGKDHFDFECPHL